MSRTRSADSIPVTPVSVPPACETVGEALSAVMTLLGKRWTGVVLATLMQGPAYFNDLRRGVTGISDRVLNERLVELAGLGLVTRTLIDGSPIRVQYELTADGAAIRPAIDALTAWAETHLGRRTADAGQARGQAPESSGAGSLV